MNSRILYIILFTLILSCSFKISVEELEVAVKEYYIEWMNNWSPTTEVLSVKLNKLDKAGINYSGVLRIEQDYGEYTIRIRVVYKDEDFTTTMDIEASRLVKVHLDRLNSKIKESIAESLRVKEAEIQYLDIKDFGEKGYLGILKTIEPAGNFTYDVTVFRIGDKFGYSIDNVRIE